MRVVFMGTPDFAVPTLRALAEAHDVAAVVTRPDAVSNRGSRPSPSAVRAVAVALGIPVMTPATLRDPAALAAIAETGCDVIVVAAYGALLPEEVLAVPPLGCLNVHASLLPRWRGAAPVQRAILAGDEVTGVCIMKMDAGLDTGPVSRCREVAVDRLDATALTAILAQEGARAVVESLEAVGRAAEVWVPQDDSIATYAAKVTRADVGISPATVVAEADRRVRASSPSAPCRIRVGDRWVTVLEAAPGHAVLRPGEVATAPAVALGLADGSLELVAVRPDGKGSMSAAAWANGARFGSGTTWETA